MMRRWRGDDDGDSWDEPQHATAASPRICLFVPWGDCNCRRYRACVCSPLLSTQEHLSPHTGHMPPNTSPLPSPSLHLAFMSFSLSVPVLLSLMECQRLADAPTAHLHGHAVSCKCPLEMKLPPTHTHTHTHTHRWTRRRDGSAVMKSQSSICPRLTLQSSGLLNEPFKSVSDITVIMT